MSNLVRETHKIRGRFKRFWVCFFFFSLTFLPYFELPPPLCCHGNKRSVKLQVCKRQSQQRDRSGAGAQDGSGRERRREDGGGSRGEPGGRGSGDVLAAAGGCCSSGAHCVVRLLKLHIHIQRVRCLSGLATWYELPLKKELAGDFCRSMVS